MDVIPREEADSGVLSSGHGQVLRLRLAPHNVPEVSKVEMLADCNIDHPFFVKDKGKYLEGKIICTHTMNII